MSSAYPGSNLDAEQLGHALILALDPDSPYFDRHLLDLELKILRIEASIRKALQRTDVLKNIVRPVNKLPPQILSNVLKYRSCERDLVAATHVCRWWRASLVSSPALWTTLRFNRDEDNHRIRTYLERSKSVAHIAIDIEMDIRQFTLKKALLELIVPHVWRVGSLTIYGRVTEVRAVLSRVFCNPAPSLRYLVIKLGLDCGDERGKGHRLPGNFLGRFAPALRSITLYGVFPVFASTFPLPNLTRFQSFGLSYEDSIRASTVCRILSISSRLKEISINLRHTSIIEDLAPNTVVSLESLEELKFSGVLAARVLPLLRLPRLRELQVASVSAKIVNFLPVDGHLLLSKATNLLYSCVGGKDSRCAVFSGGGIKIQVQGHLIDPANWLSHISPASFGQTQHLTYSGFGAVHGTLELPAAAFESLEILQFIKCAARFVGAVHLLLYKGKIPCPSLREIRCDSRPALGVIAWFVKKRGEVGDRIRLVYCSGTGTLAEVRVV